MTALTPAFIPGPLAKSSALVVSLLAPTGRFSLRAHAAVLPALSRAIGVDLPSRIGARASAGTIEVLCLSPDEWQILVAETDALRLSKGCASIYAEAPHSLTEISDREITVRIEGPKAADLLTLGCPRDIGRLGEGEGCRTLMDGATVVLWRDGKDSFRLDIWRSFAPHVVALLETGCAELAAE
ncbi:sarcosine oxidase subunit gamma family protein [Chelativorans xinjiangense]|uniref:sarcosine oxidase subunit gamma family protein n=1 Tax=Chelativorans xinjiangense TaxID=2681485 RepID=UPI0013586690|nr:sarcosine oxidase subunit gamma family protein [Chelativorans xinjiangense]